MKKDVLITIVGTQDVDGQIDKIEMTTTANVYNKNKTLYIRYEETKLTGFEGMTTTVKVEGDKRVTMLRHGTAPTQLVVEKGKRHQCSYYTGYGDIMLGITGNSIVNSMDEEGGELFFSYCMDLNTAVTSENTVRITLGTMS